MVYLSMKTARQRHESLEKKREILRKLTDKQVTDLFEVLEDYLIMKTTCYEKEPYMMDLYLLDDENE